MPKFTRSPAVLAIAVLALLSPMAALAQSEAENEREDINERQDDLAAEIDLLEASNAEIGAALDELDAAVAAQEAEVDAANQAVAVAEDALAEAEDDLAAARAEVEGLRLAIEEMAIANYIHPPVEDLVQSLTIADFDDALIARTYLDARAKRDGDLLDMLREAEATAETRAAESRRAATAAAEAAEAARSELATLQSEQDRQAQFAADVGERVDDALAEAAVLAERDAELADQVAAEQAALIERLPTPDPEAVPLSNDEPPVEQTPADPGTPSSTVPPTTTTPPPVDTSGPPVRTVYGITVHADIADQVEALVGAARSDGINLGGWGYRSNQRQIELRQAHCGSSHYAIWEMPSWQCSPPTATPGRSMHERGLAIDFTVDGRTISSRSSAGFQWLRANASGYGLRNLPSEPWHWSTNGN